MLRIQFREHLKPQAEKRADGRSNKRETGLRYEEGHFQVLPPSLKERNTGWMWVWVPF